MNTYEFIAEMTRLLLQAKKDDKAIIEDLIKTVRHKELDVEDSSRLEALEQKVNNLTFKMNLG